MTNYLKCVELCKFVWPDVEDILTVSTDKDCDINILPDPQMDRSSITAFDKFLVKCEIHRCTVCTIIGQYNCYF